jgi:hypothetical protein
MTDTFAILTQPSPVSVSLSVTDASCSSCCDGISSVSPTGGTPPYSYSWSPGNPNIQTYSNQCPGTYTVCVTDANGCTTCLSDSVSYPTSTGSISANEGIVIHPNPFNNEFTVHLNANISAIISLCDYTGKLLLRVKANSEETVLNTEGIAAGLYLLKVESGRGVRNYKVVKSE